MDRPLTDTTPAERRPQGGLRRRLSHAAGREAFARVLLLVAAALSFAFSVVLYFGGDEQAGIFVGIWVPSILALGALLVPRRAADHDRNGS